MSENEVLEYSKKLNEGLKLAEKRMLQEKALRNEDVIVSKFRRKICKENFIRSICNVRKRMYLCTR